MTREPVVNYVVRRTPGAGSGKDVELPQKGNFLVPTSALVNGRVGALL